MANPGPPISPQQVLSAAANPPVNGAVTATAPQPAAEPTKAKSPAAVEHKDGLREIVETVVFVVVLVLLLKSFVAEAFVIPTGSMAETLYGYQKIVDCTKCNYRFPVNCSKEVDPQGGPKINTVQATCPNCRHHMDFEKEGIDPSWSSGDRVLVAKFLYDLLHQHPERHDVVVFKFPREPQKGSTPTNYIKRLIGLPGETIAIHYGNLYSRSDIKYLDEARHLRPERDEDLWQSTYTYQDDPTARDMFREGKFQIVRKPPRVMLAERRIVYDNDYQNPERPRRWSWSQTDGHWSADHSDAPKRFTSSSRGTDVGWLRYQHILTPDGKLELITDFLGYNSYDKADPSNNWVSDLMLECEVTVNDSSGTFILELSQGAQRFQARFDLRAGLCTLERRTNGVTEKLDSKEVTLKAGTKVLLRFANFDDRLTLWVNNSMPFADGFSYSAPAERGPTRRNDLEPASIGVEGASVAVAQLRVWRDTYYTQRVFGRADANVQWNEPETWGALRSLEPSTYYVQRGHYMCMGDNSPESSDGREWGLVPERLLLGRALAVYYPFYFPYPPLNSRANRLGAIR